jgi:transglutaminase-like putative cysteine protease
MSQRIKHALAHYFGGRPGTGVNIVAKYSVLRPIALTLIVTTLTMVVSPAVQAMQTQSQKDAQYRALGAATRYVDLVRDLSERQLQRNKNGGLLRPMLSTAAAPGVIGRAAQSVNTGLKSLGISRGDYADLIDQLNVEHDLLRAQSAALLGRWKSAGVASSIITKQEEIDAAASSKHAQLIEKLKAANASTAATDPAQVALASFLASEVSAPSQNTLNPKNLPWQVQYAEPGTLRQPFSDSAAFRSYLAARDADTISALKTHSLKQGVTLSKALSVSSAATTDRSKALPVSTAPGALDLAPTPDAPHTDAIRELAVTTLGKNPVKIYNWVHDNIAFAPTYGSVQGAQDTLDKKSGNAFDQASLTIALLRSAGIHARYVVGTIDVPEHKLRNWIGGFKTLDAAQQVLSQGGIPNVGLVSAGRIKTMRIEHAWVEAYVSFFPSRGAKHIGGVTSGDHWIPLDPSYKQHSFSDGMNLKDTTYFDTTAFVNAAKVGATVNEAEGWVQNLNQANIKTKLDEYQSSIKQTIDAKPNATVGDVLGTQTILPEKMPFFSDTLKNNVVAVGERYSALPNSLRAQFRYGLYADAFAYSFDNPDFRYQVATSEIAGKKLTIAWVPASAADRAAIEALLPAPNPDGSPIRPEQLPQGLSGAISLKAELRIEGQAVATSGSYRAGAEPKGVGGFTPYSSLTSSGPSNTTWDETIDGLVAGQQTAMGLAVQGISKTQLDTLKTRMAATKGKLELLQANPNNSSALAGLTGDTITGDILTANVWSWFADLQSHGRIASSQATIRTKSGTDANGNPDNSFVLSGMYDRPALQYGLFHAHAQPNKIFNAVTTGITFKGVMMDIGHGRHIRWVKDTAIDVNSDLFQFGYPTPEQIAARAAQDVKKRWASYNKMRGQYSSALEHAIPERFFNDTTQCNAPGATNPDPNKPACAEGISAVKAIAIAQSQGQKVFVINATNAAVAIPQLQHRSSVIQEVQASVAAGKEVTIHESPITANGWSGAGYSVVDPETGAGGYLIEGGARGAILLVFGAFIGLIVTELLITVVASALAGPLGLGATLILSAMILTLLAPFAVLVAQMYDDATDSQKSCFWGGLLLGIGAGGFALGGLAAKAGIDAVLFYVGAALGLVIPSTGDIGSCWNAL